MNHTTIDAIDRVLDLARDKHPLNRNILLAMSRWLGGLVWAYFKGSPDEIRNRATVLAVLAVRIIEEGDQSINLHRQERGLDPYNPADENA